jgi:chromosome segregation ATPase
MKTRLLSAVPVAALFLVSLVSAFGGDDTELARLRAKAEKGNVVAQYNLGLAYAEGKIVPKDPVEAYVWLRLAADNGGTGKALGALVHDMSGDELAAAKLRLEDRRRALAAAASGSRNVATAAPAEDRFAAMQEELAVLRVDKARLTQQLASLQNASNDSAAASPATAEDRFAAMQKEIGILRYEKTALTQQNADLKHRMSDPAAADAQDVRARTAEAATQVEAAQLEAVRKDLAAAQKTNEELSAREKSLVGEQDALKHQIAESAGAAKRLADVEAQLEEARKGAVAAKDVDADREHLKQDLALLRARNDALAEANQRLEHESRGDADAQRQRADAQAAIEELKRTNAALQAQVTALTGRLAQAAPAAPGSGSPDEDLAKLKDDLGRANAKIEMTVRSFTLLREENERLKAKLAQAADAGAAPAAAQPKTP